MVSPSGVVELTLKMNREEGKNAKIFQKGFLGALRGFAVKIPPEFSSHLEWGDYRGRALEMLCGLGVLRG
jgi:hypothetical protein